MKLPTILFCSWLACSAAWAQGTVWFFNHVPTVNLDAPVTDGVAGPKIDGTNLPGARVELYAGPAGTTENNLLPVAPAVGFMSGSWAGYFNVGADGSRTIPGVLAGSNAVVQVRAWSGATTYETALTTTGAKAGKSVLLTLATGGQTASNTVPMLPANLVGLQAFAIAPVSTNSGPTITLGITYHTNAVLTLSGLTGHAYQLQYNSTLGSTNWSALVNVTLTGTTTNVVDAGSTNAPRRFYRALQTQ